MAWFNKGTASLFLKRLFFIALKSQFLHFILPTGHRSCAIKNINKSERMKTHKGLIKSILFFSIVCITCLQIAHAQDEKKEKQVSKAALIKNLVDSQNFVFAAQSVLPLRGATRQLSSYYDVAISKDSLVMYLPYFGRAYTAPQDPANVGLNFTSTNFGYSKIAGKKGGWDITIRPKDHTEVHELLFRIFDNGSTSLQVISVNRDQISFQGYITEKRQKK